MQSRTTAIALTLWVIQVLLAALFVFAGAVKLMFPIEALTQQMPLPGWFLRFVGAAELAGGLGMLLPASTRIGSILIPLAARGLMVIMIGATALTIGDGAVASAIMPATVGTLLAFVVYGPSRVVPHVETSYARTVTVGA